MKLSEVAMLVVSSSRTKAYLQLLIKNNLYPSHLIILENSSNQPLPGQLISDVTKKDSSVSEKMTNIKQKNPYFNPNEPLIETIKKSNLDYEVCYNDDINSEDVVNILRKRPEKYIIYSGFGGVILKKGILNCGKKFLHIHPGYVPFYRGSTPLYYSILKEDKCFASAIFLEEKIDAGSVIKIKEYLKPKNGESIDYIYDPYIRADLLVEVVKNYLEKGQFMTKQQGKDGETYFIIHPLLKHIAISSCN